ncbi:MAG TPA: hypothetical protein VJQ07_07905, partial [Gaiellaceae bacterium]|nr:hypothetical protein [Gaiellaceae bacterium]
MRVGALLVLLSVGAVVAGCAGSGPATREDQRSRPRPLAVYAAAKRIETVRPGSRRIRLPRRIELRRGRARIG